MMKITERTKAQDAKVLHITQPRGSALLEGKFSDFRLESLVDMAHRLGMHLSINVAAWV
jgi:predicted XRE-type DNA-binding protein